MKKLLALVLVVTFLSGCGSLEEPNIVGYVHSGKVTFDKFCVEGVFYLKHSGGYMAPYMKADGSVHTCAD